MNIFTGVPEPKQPLKVAENVERQIGIILERLEGLREDNREIKAQLNQVQKMDNVINLGEVGILDRLRKIEKEVSEIRSYVQTQKTYIAVVSGAFTAAGMALGYLAKLLIAYFKA